MEKTTPVEAETTRNDFPLGLSRFLAFWSSPLQPISLDFGTAGPFLEKIANRV
jgi:hypothetical protein